MKKVLIVITFLMLTSIVSSEEVASSSDSPEFNLFSEFTCFGGTENELYHYDFGAVKDGKRTVVSYQEKEEINADCVTDDCEFVVKLRSNEVSINGCATTDDLIACNIKNQFSKDDGFELQVEYGSKYMYISTILKMHSNSSFIQCEQQVLTPKWM